MTSSHNTQACLITWVHHAWSYCIHLHRQRDHRKVEFRLNKPQQSAQTLPYAVQSPSLTATHTVSWRLKPGRCRSESRQPDGLQVCTSPLVEVTVYSELSVPMGTNARLCPSSLLTWCPACATALLQFGISTTTCLKLILSLVLLKANYTKNHLSIKP